jgi:hypothetical protein
VSDRVYNAGRNGGPAYAAVSVAANNVLAKNGVRLPALDVLDLWELPFLVYHRHLGHIKPDVTGPDVYQLVEQIVH